MIEDIVSPGKRAERINERKRADTGAGSALLQKGKKEDKNDGKQKRKKDYLH